MDCRIIGGTGITDQGSENHSWNIICLNGRYYNADATWDAVRTPYAYFLLSDANYGDHIRDNGTLFHVDYTGSAFYTDYPMSPDNYDYHSIESCTHDFTAVVTPPTCLDEGYTTYTCVRCGNTYNADIVPANGHQPVSVPAIPATCTEPGLTEGKHCTVCELVLIPQQSVPAAGHTETVDKAIAPTCTAPGLTEGRHCAVCELVLIPQTEIPATGHTEVIDPAVDATCTSTGLTEGAHCGECHAVLIAQTVIDLADHQFTNYVPDGNATPDRDGTKTAKCDNCEATETVVDEGSQLQHVPGKWNVVKKATCIEPGLQTAVCEVCGAEMELVIAPHGTPVVEIEEIPATCTANGKTAKISCSECGKVIQKQKTIKKGHLLTELCCDETGHWYKCEREDCDAIGKVTVHKYDVDSCEDAAHCEDCGYEKAAGEHIPGKWKVTKKATCIEDGIQTSACVVCGEKLESVIEAHGEAVVEIAEVPATCTANGKTAKISCSECGKVIQKQKTIKKGHLLTELCCDETGHWYKCEREDCDAIGKVTAHKYDVDSCEDAAHCEDCGYEKAAGEHIPGKWKIAKKATCIEDGLQTTSCKICKKKIEAVIEAHGEAVIEIPEEPATCTENGKTAKISCSECGKVIQKQKTIKKGHLLTELHFDDSKHWYECQREGCDAIGKAKAHKYKGGICTTCGHEKE